MYTVTAEPIGALPRLSRWTVKINGTIVGYGWKEECESLAEELVGDHEKCREVLKAMEEINGKIS